MSPSSLRSIPLSLIGSGSPRDSRRPTPRVIRSRRCSVLDPADVCQDGAANSAPPAAWSVARCFPDGPRARLATVEPSVPLTGGQRSILPLSAPRRCSDRHRAQWGVRRWMERRLAVRPARGFHHFRSSLSSAPLLQVCSRAGHRRRAIPMRSTPASNLPCSPPFAYPVISNRPDAKRSGAPVHRVCAAAVLSSVRRIARRTRVPAAAPAEAADDVRTSAGADARIAPAAIPSGIVIALRHT